MIMTTMKCMVVGITCLSLQQVVIVAQQKFDILECFTPCANGFTGNEAIPSTGCKYYHECWNGVVRSQKECGSPLIFDEENDYCNFPSNVVCPEGPEYISCPESYSPTGSLSTESPTESPTASGGTPAGGTPTVIQTSIPIQIQPVRPLSNAPTDAPTILLGGNAILHVESKRDLIEKYVLISYNKHTGLAYPSISYTYDRFIQSLQIMGVDGFGADFKFNLFEGNKDKYHYGLVNLAAFLANSMVESIEDDTCDESNWQETNGRHAISNSCGMESRSYQDETCDTNEDIFSCEVVPEMDITAASTAAAERAAPPMSCKPGSGQWHHSGYWDSQSGTLFASAPYSNDLGRTDTEGCCWWGRGALLTKGVCNIGKINYHLGKRGADLGRTTLYPTVDFCEYPEATCASVYSGELRWTIALFEWAERVQGYKRNEWNYEEKLMEFVDYGMKDDEFINSVSRILSQGCHASGCSEYEVRMLDKRRSNFYLIINDIFDIETLLNSPDPTRHPTKLPTPRPTGRPTKQPTMPPVNVISSPADPSPSQTILTMPTTPNPTENQNTNPSPVVPIALPDQSPYTPKQPQFTPSKIAQPAPPPSNNNSGNVDEETYAPTYYGDGERLIGLEGNGIINCRNQQVLISLTVMSAAYFLLLL